MGRRVEGVIHADAELVELIWVEIGSKPLADLHPMTKNVLGELEKRLATGPLSHDAPVPFFHFYGGKIPKATLACPPLPPTNQLPPPPLFPTPSPTPAPTP